jgi:cell division protein FtsN
MMVRHVALIALLGLITAVPRARAQAGADDSVRVVADAVFDRARQLVASGNGAAGRMLVDSVLASLPPEAPVYADALYWRASLASTSGDAERDYRRIVVQFPLAERAADALLQLAQIEVIRGDRAAAAVHLQRFLLENPQHPARARAGYLLTRAYFEQDDMARGCAALGRARSELPREAIEQRNQLDYLAPRCVGVDTASRAGGAEPSVRDTTPAARTDSAPGDKARKPSAASPQPATRARGSTGEAAGAKANASSGKYTLQVAAYSARSSAEQLVKRLIARGVEARVVGKAKPFRVRVGRYATRGDASAAAKQLKTKRIEVFVTEIGIDDR